MTVINNNTSKFSEVKNLSFFLELIFLKLYILLKEDFSKI